MMKARMNGKLCPKCEQKASNLTKFAKNGPKMGSITCLHEKIGFKNFYNICIFLKNFFLEM